MMARRDGLTLVHIILACGLALGPTATTAAEPAPITVSGGAIDPTITDMEVYVGAPAAAKAPPECRVAVKYLDYLNSGQFDRMASLYADGAVVMPPLFGKRAVGEQAIHDFYANTVSKVKPNVIAVSYASGPRECFQVHAIRTLIDGQPRYVVRTVDHFRFNAAGKIISMMAFPRPRAAH